MNTGQKQKDISITTHEIDITAHVLLTSFISLIFMFQIKGVYHLKCVIKNKREKSYVVYCTQKKKQKTLFDSYSKK